MEEPMHRRSERLHGTACTCIRYPLLDRYCRLTYPGLASYGTQLTVEGFCS